MDGDGHMKWPHEMKIMVMVCTYVMMIKLWDLEKKKEKNKMGSRPR